MTPAAFGRRGKSWPSARHRGAWRRLIRGRSTASRRDWSYSPSPAEDSARQRPLSGAIDRAGGPSKIMDEKTVIAVYDGTRAGELAQPPGSVTARNAPAIVKAAGRAAEFAWEEFF